VVKPGVRFVRLTDMSGSVPARKIGPFPHQRGKPPYFVFIQRCAELLELEEEDIVTRAKMAASESWRACYADQMSPAMAVATWKANSREWANVKATVKQMLATVGLRPIGS
jgi:hypothetical protein